MPALMKLHTWARIPMERLNESLERQVVHTNLITMARLYMKKGAIVPRHHHVNEQVTNVEKGRLRFFFDAEDVIVEAGDSLQIPSNLPHGVEALEDSVAFDLFSPVREDWVRGDDAYLRR